MTQPWKLIVCHQGRNGIVAVYAAPAGGFTVSVWDKRPWARRREEIGFPTSDEAVAEAQRRADLLGIGDAADRALAGL